jgi:hypothetical protein
VNPEDGAHYVRSFGVDVPAEFEDGETLGIVHATMVRSFTYVDDKGNFENGQFWGLLEFSSDLTEATWARLFQGDLVRRGPGQSLPLPSFVVQVVRHIRSDTSCWLAIEVRG